MMRHCLPVVAMLSIMVGAVTAAPALIDKDVEAARVASTALAAAMRIQSQATIGTADRGQLEQLLERSMSLQAMVEGQRARISMGPYQQLQLASAQLEQAMDQIGASATAPAGTNAILSGGVSGTVTDASNGAPLAGVGVRAFEFTTRSTPSGVGIVAFQITGATGTFTLTLPPGRYQISTQGAGAIAPAPGFVDQAYGLTCDDVTTCATYLGNIISVVDATTISGIDFALGRAGGVSGTVRKAADLSALGGIRVDADSENRGGGGLAISSSTAGSEGAYQINGLPPGRYRIYASLDPDASGAEAGLESTAYSNKPCAFDCNYIPVDWVTVTANTITPAIDITAAARSSLSGRIVDDQSAPITDGNVTLISEDGWTYVAASLSTSRSGASIGVGGNYYFAQVRPGNYRVFVNAPGYLSEVYPNVRCDAPVSCGALAVGGVVTVPPATAVTGIDLSLSRGASISGTVTRAADNSAVVGVRVSAGNTALGSVGFAETDADGKYRIGGLPDATLHVWAVEGGDLTDTVYGNGVCPGADGANCLDAGLAVTTSATSPATGVDIAMAGGGRISGVITDALTGLPAPRNLMRAEIFQLQAPGQPQASSYTYLATQTLAGGYIASGIAPGAYKVVFVGSSVAGWIDTAFGGAPCPRGGCDRSLLPTVWVTAGATTASISGTVPRGVLVSGTVTDAASGQPVRAPAFDPSGGSSAAVAFYTASGTYAGFAMVDGAGRYLSRAGFAPGPLFAATFLARNNAPFGGNYVDQAYAGITCPWLSCDVTSATPLSIAGTNLAGIDFALHQGGTLSGTITRSGDAVPLEAVVIEAFNGAGTKVAQARSNPLGGYIFYGLPTGSVFVRTSNQLGYQDEVYNNIGCEPDCDPVTGIAVPVTAPMATNGIDFALAPQIAIFADSFE